MEKIQAPSRFLGSLRVVAQVPEALSGLQDLARNLVWSWNPEARMLFREIDEETWRACAGNPMRFMKAVRQSVLERASKDTRLLGLYDKVMASFNAYIAAKDTWFKREMENGRKHKIAYFSAEYGLHEALPIYSGGLGVLAGDHLKSASDIGLPFCAVGLLYREGYFIQDIDSEGRQQALFHRLEWSDLPIAPAVDASGEEVYIQVELPGRVLRAKVWEARVGRISLYLLDADIPDNNAADRALTQRLYGGDQETRIQQEVLLGIGGVRALRALAIAPTVFHMNEGHSAFLGLERVRELIHDEGLAFEQAREVVRASSLFTTHTPVPAGNDAFPLPMMEKYFRHFYESISLTRGEFMNLGMDTAPDGGQLFSMTVLALAFSSMSNGVSELHGHVARSMWQHIWPSVPVHETPIDHITNGVHTCTWLSIDMAELLDKHFEPGWRERLDDPATWQQIDKVPDAELWAVISKLRADLVHFIHTRLRAQHTRFGESPDTLRELEDVFAPSTLTIGFARRFATYKRGTLIFRDKERLARILNNPERPIQIVFSGKAHPADNPGQEFIRQIQLISREEPFHNKVVFLENYDMNIGRRLTSGVDIWLNNPRRPLEASGTSGMKVPLNGGLNCSILDGWWREAYGMNPLAGWALGEEVAYDDPALQDAADAESIYHTLEDQIAPLFYDVDADGIPSRWLARVRESMKACAGPFSTNRMVKDYTRKFYMPGSIASGLVHADRFARAKANADWKRQMREAWPGIRIHARAEGGAAGDISLRVRETVDIVAEVELGHVDPADVAVEIYLGSTTENGNHLNTEGWAIEMHPEGPGKSGRRVYRGTIQQSDAGEFGYTVRVVPRHNDLFHPQEMGLVAWA